MIQRDFIQRLIHQISAVLARMIGKNAEEQLIILEEYIQQHNGLGSEDLEKVSDEDLLNYLSEDMQLNPYQIEAIAAALHARGDIFVTNKNTDKAIIEFRRAISLLDYVDNETAIYSFDRIDMITTIKKKLKQINGA